MFELIRTTQMPEYDGTGYFYRHDKTGMEVFHVKNSSEELTCAFTFATPSQDSTGLAHILEHTVLCGSGRFPVKDPFTEIYNSSPNTFLNAMTFYDKTMYPFSSPLKKDFDIIFDIYADAVFNPLLRKQSFEQEGVRFYNGKVDGVVFNEMRGARSSEDSVVNTYCVNKLFKGTPYEYDSGGDPVFIADLTYQMYLDRYRQWYSPANCRLFLYGNMDAEEYLEKIERLYLDSESLKKWTGEKIITSSQNYVAKGNYEPLYDKRYCCTKNASDVVLTWLTQRADSPFENLVLSILVDILLGNPGSPLYKAITESDLGEDLNPMSGMDEEYPVLPFTIGFTGAKKNKETEIERFILSELRKIADSGLDENAVRASLKRQAFAIREIKGAGYPYGVLLAMRAARYWLRGTDPESALNNEACLAKLNEEVSKGRFFETWIQKNLLENPRRCLLTVTEDCNYENELQAELDEKYRKRTTDIDSEEYKADRQKFEDFLNYEDTAEDLACIRKISKEDIPCRIPDFNLVHREIKGVEIETMELFTRGITYVNMAFDITYLQNEEKFYMPLLVRFLQMCGTRKHDYTDVGILVKQNTGGFSVSQVCSSTIDNKPLSLLFVRTKALDCDFKAALDITLEILQESVFSDCERIRASLVDLVTDYESSYIDNANIFASLRSSSSLSAICAESEISSGTSGYLFASGLLKDFDANKEQIAGKLELLRNKIINREKLKIQIGCESNNLDKALVECADFVCRIPAFKTENDLSFYENFNSLSKQASLIKISGGPSYNSLAFRFNSKNETETAKILLLASILSGNFLFETIRGQNGAYGAECHVDGPEKIFLMSSYRDPCIDETFKVFRDSLSYCIKQEEIDSTVVTIIGRELKPLIPNTRCFEAFRRFLFGMTDKIYLERRAAIMSASPADMKETAEKMKKYLDAGSYATITGLNKKINFFEENGINCEILELEI